MTKTMPEISSGGRQQRTDIQVLRAIAVCMVLLFHAQMPGLVGGFLGVDIFLVISGYLITSLIVRGVECRSFGIGAFFLDRSKRLLPAAYTVYLLTGVAALWFLTEAEMQRYLETLLAALTFTANIFLWQGTDYFAAEAKLNVLLHVWSLSLEEQFYFILPVVLVFIPRRFWSTIIISAFAISLILCFMAVRLMPVASFYLLPTRAWELLIGSILALNEHRLSAVLRGWLERLGVPALAVIVLVPVFMPGERLGFVHPSLDALLVTLAAAVLIAGKPDFMNRACALTRVFYWIGGISYSLYLVHWPLFAFALNAHLGEIPPLEVRIGLIALSVLLATALHAGIERPIHRMDLVGRRTRTALVALGATGGMAIAGVGLTNLRDGPVDYAAAAAPNYGLSAACDYTGLFDLREECRTGETPRTLVWGDSFAMQVVGALPDELHPIVQATKSGCAPALGIAQIVPETWQDAGWAAACIGFNDSVAQYLDAHPEIKTVVISSTFGQILGQQETGLLRSGNRLVRSPLSFEEGAARFARSIEAISAKGRHVLVIGPTPSVGVNMLACLERSAMGLVSLGPHQRCLLDRDEARAFRKAALDMLGQVADTPGVTFIDLIEILCPQQTCLLQIDETLMFRDAGHLSLVGAHLLGARGAIGPTAGVGSATK